MTRLPFSQVLISVVLASTLGLAGCDVETEGDAVHTSPLAYGENIGGIGCDVVDAITGDCALVDTPAPGFYVPGTHPRFTPAAADIPLNTDILFAGSTDGTAYIDMTADPTNPVYAAINDIDGWSTNAPFNIPFSGAINPASVDADPMSPAQNVFVIALNAGSGGDALADIDMLDPIDMDYTVPVTAAAVSLDGGTNNVLRITPTEPLQGPRKYLVIVTNGITDTLADPITASSSYELLGAANGDLLGAAACAANGINVALHPLCDAIGGWEALAVGYLQGRNTFLNTTYDAMPGWVTLPTDAAVLQSSLALTYTFTTTDPVSPMLAMATPRAALIQAQQQYGIAQATAISNVVDTMTTDAVTLSTPSARTVSVNAATATPLSAFSAALTSGADLYTGTIDLPYYQTAPTSTTDVTWFANSWAADVAIGGSTAGDAIAAAIGAPALPLPDLDGSYNVTYRYPFAAATETLTVPLQITLPDDVYTPVGAPADCGTLYNGMDGTGYPVVIYVHGITSDRTSVVALADALAKACIATVAIDLPMHGVAANSAFASLNIEHSAGLSALYPNARERHFDQRMNPATGQPVAMNWATPDAALDGSGTLFINLLNFANTRDNLKQAVMDLLNLNASLGTISALNLDAASSATDFDLTKVYVTGVSLGGIIGTTFTAVNQLAYAGDAQIYGALLVAGSPAAPLFAPRLNVVKALATSAPGSQLTRVLENSQAFSPSILGGLAAAGAPQGTGDFESFFYVFQGVTDSADPINFASILDNGTVPTPGFGTTDVLTENGLDVKLLMQEIVGLPSDPTELAADQAVLTAIGDTSPPYTADKVVPNNAYPTALGAAIPAPLAGTDPLADLLGLTQVTTVPAAASSVGNGALVKIQIGHHASLLRPNENALLSPYNGEYLATVEMQTEVVTFLNSAGSTFSVGTGGAAIGMPANTAAQFIKTN